MIHDRIVIGILDQALSQRMQMDPDLTLEKTLTSVRQREAVKEQEAVLGKTAPTSAKLETSVDFVRKGKAKNFKPATLHKTEVRYHSTRPTLSPNGVTYLRFVRKIRKQRSFKKPITIAATVFVSAHRCHLMRL